MSSKLLKWLSELANGLKKAPSKVAKGASRLGAPLKGSKTVVSAGGQEVRLTGKRAKGYKNIVENRRAESSKAFTEHGADKRIAELDAELASAPAKGPRNKGLVKAERNKIANSKSLYNKKHVSPKLEKLEAESNKEIQKLAEKQIKRNATKSAVIKTSVGASILGGGLMAAQDQQERVNKQTNERLQQLNSADYDDYTDSENNQPEENSTGKNLQEEGQQETERGQKNPSEAADVSNSPSYTVKTGDTLSKIAADNNTTVEDILAKNKNITNPDLIYEGLEIKLDGNISDEDRVDALARMKRKKRARKAKKEQDIAQGNEEKEDLTNVVEREYPYEYRKKQADAFVKDYVNKLRGGADPYSQEEFDKSWGKWLLDNYKPLNN